MTMIDEFVFEPARAGMWDDRSPAGHEAAHAVVALFFGFTVLECRIDGDLEGGVTRLVRSELWERLWEALIVRMVGPAWGGIPIAWPPARGCDGDEDMCALIVSRLGMNEDGWRECERFVADLLRIGSPRRSEIRSVTRALEQYGALRGDDVNRLIRDASGGA